MNELDFKIQIICDISFLNEKSIIIRGTKDSEIEKIRNDVDHFFLGEGKKISSEEKSFCLFFLKTIEDLEKWVNGKMFITWDEDDVNFLNFLLNSRWLYEKKTISIYETYIKELLKRVVTPLFLKIEQSDSFFSDLS